MLDGNEVDDLLQGFPRCMLHKSLSQQNLQWVVFWYLPSVHFMGKGLLQSLSQPLTTCAVVPLGKTILYREHWLNQRVHFCGFVPCIVSVLQDPSLELQ